MVGIRYCLFCTINGNEIHARCDVIAERLVCRVVLLGYDLVRHGCAIPKHVYIIQRGYPYILRTSLILLQLAVNHAVGIPALDWRENCLVIQLALVLAGCKGGYDDQFRFSSCRNDVWLSRQECEHILVVVPLFCRRIRRKRVGIYIPGAAIDCE